MGTDSIRKYLRQTYEIAAQLSDDIHTKNGALILSPTGSVITIGANAFPSDVKLQPDRLVRPLKYEYLIHAETNAILAAARAGVSIRDCTMVAGWAACTRCAQNIIESGITTLITHLATRYMTPARWQENIALADNMMKEAGVKIILFDEEIGGVENLFNQVVWKP